jgi:hypothetical protein
VFDEIKIRQSLVIDKDSGNIIGFTDTGDFNTKLNAFDVRLRQKAIENEVATHVLAVCIRGIFMKMENILGHFLTTTISGKELYDIIWAAVGCLNDIGLTVVAIVSDGISSNRKFFNIHKHEDCVKECVVYKVINIFNPTK